MIANYGYKDGSGEYFISIGTDKCAQCKTGECVEACPAQILERITDDYDDVVCAVKEASRNKLKYMCAPCHPIGAQKPPVCIAACPHAAIKMSW